METTVLLVLTLIMPGRMPDTVGKFPVDSLTECWEMAHAWVDKGLTEREQALGGVAVAGACYTNKPEVKT